MEFVHLAKPIKIDNLKLVIKNLHNIFLKETNKIEADIDSLRDDFIYDVIFFYFFYF